MTESRILWLALGVVVGFMLWGESRKCPNCGSSVNLGGPIAGEPLGGLPPKCGSCGG